MTSHATRAGTALAVFGLATALAGCSRDKTAETVAAKNTSNIQRLGNIYAAHQNMKSGKGPKDEADFKKFISEYPADKLSMMGISAGDLGKLFTSDRDGQPFTIRYNVGGGRGSVDAVVFEKAGQNGKKQVGFTGGRVDDVDDAEYKELLAGKRREVPPGAPPSAGGGRPGSGAPPGAKTGPAG